MTAVIHTPPYLRPGDTIGICATARKVTMAEIEPAVRILESWGLYVVFGKNLFKSEHQFSGSDEERADDLQAFLDDPGIKAVISARGGYGTMRIVDRLDFSAFAESPKWIIGYSDITVLHSHIHRNFHLATMHGTMPINFEKDKTSTESLRHALFGEPLGYRAENASGVPNVPGEAAGRLVGGNLSLLYALQGSVSDIDMKGKILFLEDLDEYLYHIDRMLLSLDRAGKLAGLKGLIVGGMSEMKDNAVPFGKTAEAIVLSHAAKYKFPVCFGFPAGHDVKNYALPFGEEIHLSVEKAAAQVTFVFSGRKSIAG